MSLSISDEIGSENEMLTRYSGMENPVFTFATPTLISGDRANVDVVAHELAHSWSGNLVGKSHSFRVVCLLGRHCVST